MSAAPDFLPDLERRVEVRAARAARIAWPSPRYEHDPIGFCRDILDFEPWEHPEPGISQADVIRAASREDSRVSWVSCHKVGKSRALAALPLWDFATFTKSRTFLFAPKIEHIENIALWPEIRQLYLNSGRCKACRTKEHAKCCHAEGRWRCEPQPPCPWCSPLGDAAAWNEDPVVGLKSADGRREIKAYTATIVDALGGLSGQRMRFIFDEAGGIKPMFFEAMHGNSAGGVSWLMAGNPLHTSGEQYDAHHSQKHKWQIFETSAEHSPNVRAGFKMVPGLATREWMQDRAEAWGKDSSTYAIRVLGKFPKYTPGQLLRVDEVEAAEKRWALTRFEGRLQLGVDVAFTGDEAVIAPRRGYKIGDLVVVRDTNPDELAERVLQTARDLRLPHERPPLVAYDAQGKAGQDFGNALLRLPRIEDELEIIGVRTDAPPRDRQRFGDRRTELAFGFASFLKRGGAIPTDVKLEGEIGWMITRPRSKDDQRPVLPSNDELKKQHGRSPDRFDACKLATAFVGSADAAGDARGTVSAPQSVPAAPPPVAQDEETTTPSQSVYERQAAVYRNLWGRT